MPRDMRVIPYDAAWSVAYENEKNLLVGLFGNLIVDIQHFGSTAIAGMSAKPVIDIMIVVQDVAAVDGYNDTMVENGYLIRGENGIRGRRYFVKLNPDDSGNHSHHVHVYQQGNPHIADELMFRDYLGLDHDAFLEYERTKLEASARFYYSPNEYVDAKQECVMRIMAKARAYFAERA